MTPFCPRCRQSLTVAAAFCPNCGASVAAPLAAPPGPPAGVAPTGTAVLAAAPQPSAYAPGAGYGAPAAAYAPPPNQYGPSPGAYPNQAGPYPQGAAAAQPFGAASAPVPAGGLVPGAQYGPNVSPPSATPGARQMLMGVGALGCAGVIIAGIFGVAILVVSNLRKSSAQSSSAEPTQPNDPSAGRQPAPSQGSLKDLARTQVGPYKLVGAGQPNLPSALREDLTDSLGVSYEGSGVKVDHILLAYASAEQSAKVCGAMAQVLGEKRRVRKISLSDRQGVHIGDMAVISGGASELVLWNDKNLCLQTTAPPPHAFEFAKAVPY